MDVLTAFNWENTLKLISFYIWVCQTEIKRFKLRTLLQNNLIVISIHRIINKHAFKPNSA